MLGKLLLGATAGAYILFDVNYLVRCVPTYLGLFCKGKKKGKQVTDWFVSYGICTTNDLDFFLHMNNARYLREFEFARTSFCLRSGLWQSAKDLGSSGIVSAVSVRYRRSVTLLHVFRIRTRLVYWTDRDVYVEQFMETVHDDFVRAVSFGKLTFTGNGTVNDILEAVTNNDVPFKDDPPPDLRCWIEANKISSDKLRKQA